MYVPVVVVRCLVDIQTVNCALTSINLIRSSALTNDNNFLKTHTTVWGNTVPVPGILVVAGNY